MNIENPPTYEKDKEKAMDMANAEKALRDTIAETNGLTSEQKVLLGQMAEIKGSAAGENLISKKAVASRSG